MNRRPFGVSGLEGVEETSYVSTIRVEVTLGGMGHNGRVDLSRNETVELAIRRLSKRYSRGIWALRDFSRTLRPGVLGLLGPNGAGKSTLMRIVATITRPTQGRVLWNGEDIVARPDPLREVLGYL